jgi:lysophospholipase L1-like esterase
MRAALMFVMLAACSPAAGRGDDMPMPGDDAPGPTTDAAIDPPAGTPLDLLDEPALVIVVGDSIAAGYNAANNNAPGGRGYARLVVDNHATYPAYAQNNIRAMAAGVQWRDLSASGANSSEAATAVRNASLPAVTGDVLVLVNVGGNDFNDSVQTMIDANATAQAAQRLRENLADIASRLRTRYEDTAGEHVVIVMNTIHDPTDGTGTIPPQYDDGFCGTIQNPLFTPQLRMQALANLGTRRRHSNPCSATCTRRSSATV